MYSPKGKFPNRSVSSRPPGLNGMPGITLLEITVVILVLLSLIGVLFIGARAWKRGSDRAICIIHIQSVQKGVRSYANLYGFGDGDNAPGLKAKVIGMGRFVESTPLCPSSGTYSFGTTYGVDTIPPVGELYLQCTLATTAAHEPPNHGDW
jgi:hypothetical protein